MANEQKKRKSEENSEAYTFSDEATHQKIKKHITDINDVITEQDIANVKVPGEDDPLPDPPAKQEDETKDEEKGKLAGDGKPITPWDVID